jgi:ribosomal protein L37AE/L43A
MGPDDDVANRVEDMGRKHDGPECPECGGQNVQPAQGWDSNIYECQDCGKQDYYENFDPGDLLGLENYLGKELSMERVASLKKFAYPDASMFVEPLNAVHDKAKDPNFIPQSDKVTAPAEVNTLRNELLCPVCKASNMEVGRDGILECSTCGHVQEPEPLNNPDLSISQDNDLKQDNLPTDTEPMNPEVQYATEGITFTPTASKLEYTEGVISEMFEVILTTASDEIVDKVIPLDKVARQETVLGTRFPLGARTYRALKEAGLLDSVTVEFPATKATHKLGEVAPIANLFAAEKEAIETKSKVEEVTIVVEAGNEEDLAKAMEIIQSTKSKTAATTKPKSKVTILPPDKDISDGPKETKILEDQLAPVESAVTINIDSTEPEAEEIPKEEVVEAAEETPSVEEVVEDVEQAEEDAGDESAEESEKEAKLLTAFRLADMSVELGLVEATNKMVFISELEEETLEALEAREATLNSVKSAGLSRRTAATKVAGLKKLPRLSHTGASVRDAVALDVMDEALFL